MKTNCLEKLVIEKETCGLLWKQQVAGAERERSFQGQPSGFISATEMPSSVEFPEGSARFVVMDWGPCPHAVDPTASA
ncbi:hypothetical protein OJAV_G00171180 [Oryzias javanicus]|uniref:Uncharacterized protein n=1 Tax=Oryzias javanicus TaxID=123683 RepID=A0A437CGN4_ORYJA|nr:hypothetical protein OJAV_G00171180 [Oryzias javanicus]